jgi:hypothetical protein
VAPVHPTHKEDGGDTTVEGLAESSVDDAQANAGVFGFKCNPLPQPELPKMYQSCFPPRPTPPKNPPPPPPPPVESHVSELPVEIAQLDVQQPPLTQGAQSKDPNAVIVMSKGPQCSYIHEQ